MKTCSTCDMSKEESEFYTRSDTGKLRGNCKTCIKKVSDKRRNKNRTKELEKQRAYYQRTKERQNTLRRLRYKNNKEKELRVNRQWALNNTDKVNYYAKKSREKHKIARMERIKKRRISDPLFRLKINLRTSVGRYLNNKPETTCEVIGMSWQTLYKYLQDTFEANYGMPREWMESFNYHIDHIIPLSSAGSAKELYKLNHYTNLQILLAEDNLSKGAKNESKFGGNFRSKG